MEWRGKSVITVRPVDSFVIVAGQPIRQKCLVFKTHLAVRSQIISANIRSNLFHRCAHLMEIMFLTSRGLFFLRRQEKSIWRLRFSVLSSQPNNDAILIHEVRGADRSSLRINPAQTPQPWDSKTNWLFPLRNNVDIACVSVGFKVFFFLP